MAKHGGNLNEAQRKTREARRNRRRSKINAPVTNQGKPVTRGRQYFGRVG